MNSRMTGYIRRGLGGFRVQERLSLWNWGVSAFPVGVSAHLEAPGIRHRWDLWSFLSGVTSITPFAALSPLG